MFTSHNCKTADVLLSSKEKYSERLGKVMKGKKKILIVIGAVLLVSVTVLGFKSAADGGGNDVKSNTYVEGTRIETGEIESVIYTSGRVVPKESTTVYSEFSGMALDVMVEVGTIVKKGDPLVILDTENLDKSIRDAKISLDIAELNYKASHADQSMENQVNSLENTYSSAKKTYEENQSLYEVGAITKKTLDVSKDVYNESYNTYISAQNSLNLNTAAQIAELQLQGTKNTYDDLLEMKEKSIVRAKIDGTITNLQVKVNDLVGESSPVALIETAHNLEITTSIGEYEVDKIKIGQNVRISGDGVGNDEYMGRVSLINPSASSQVSAQGSESNIGIEIEIIDEETKFKPYYTARLEIQHGLSENALLVPYEVIYVDDQNVSHVFLIEDSIITDVVVEIGVQGEIEIEIVSDKLESNDLLVLNPSNDLENQMTVELLREQ